MMERLHENVYILYHMVGWFMGFDQSLWLDEATTAQVVARYTIPQIFSQFSPTDFHPPFYYFFMDVWTSVFGYSEVALRMPSFIFAVLAGVTVYKIVEMRGDAAAARWAAALFLFNPLIVYYAQEARMYMLAVLLVTLIYYGTIRILTHQRNVVRLIFVTILIALALMTFYGTVFFIAALYGYVLLKKRWRVAVQLMGGPIIALALIGPLFAEQLRNSGEQLGVVANWASVLGTASLKNLILFPIKFAAGRISWEPKSAYYAIVGLWTLFVFGTLARYIHDNYRKRKRDIRTPVYFFVIPVILGILFSFYKPLLQYFRFIYVIPFMCILLAAAAARSAWLRRAYLIGFFIFSCMYMLNPAFHREDWKSLVNQLPRIGTVYMIPSSADPLLYYNPLLTVADIRTAQPRTEGIYVVPYTTEIYGFDYETYLTERGYTKIRIVTVRGLTAELWSRKKRFAES